MWVRRMVTSEGIKSGRLESAPPSMMFSEDACSSLFSMRYGPEPSYARMAWESKPLSWISSIQESAMRMSAPLASRPRRTFWGW